MTLLHEHYVRERFDALHARFDDVAARDDVRWTALQSALPRHLGGLRVLDLGCGKGRFAVLLRAEGARVIGLDPSPGMLAYAAGLERVLGTSRRLPFATGTFDAVVAVESLAHAPAEGFGEVLDEVARVLRPEGVAAIVDKSAASLNARRPWLPSLAIKWVDQRRGRWMYPADAPVRERWFWPGMLRRELGGRFAEASVDHLLSYDEADHAVFRRFPRARLMALWTARRPRSRDG